MSEAVKKTYKHGFLYKIAVTFLTVIIIVVIVIVITYRIAVCL